MKAPCFDSIPVPEEYRSLIRYAATAIQEPVRETYRCVMRLTEGAFFEVR